MNKTTTLAVIVAAALTGTGSLVVADVSPEGPIATGLVAEWEELTEEPQEFRFGNPDGTCPKWITVSSGRDQAQGTIREAKINKRGPCTYEISAREHIGTAVDAFWAEGGGFPAGLPGPCINPIQCPTTEGGSPQTNVVIDPPEAVGCLTADSWTYTNTPENPSTRTFIGFEFCWDGNEAWIPGDPSSHCLATNGWSVSPCSPSGVYPGPSTGHVDADKFGDFYKGSLYHGLGAVLEGYPDGDHVCRWLVAEDTTGYDGDLLTGCNPPM